MELTDESISDPQCESQLVTLSHSEVSNQLNNRMCLDSKLNCQTYIEQEMVNTDAVSPCIVDIYVEKGHSGMPKASETGEKLKIEGSFTVSSILYCLRKFCIVYVHNIISPQLRIKVKYHLGGNCSLLQHLTRYLLTSYTVEGWDNPIYHFP